MASNLRVLVLNAGSSSLKYQVVDPASADVSVRGSVERIGDGEVPDHDSALARMRADLEIHGVQVADLSAVGHRVVHGGPDLVEPTVIDDDVLAEIDDLAELAPLHNPPAAAGIRSARQFLPGLAQVAVFDTAYFADLPATSATYAVDAALARRHRVRRYGAHGISHEYVAGRAAAFLDRDPADLDQIVLHLGNGASASAIRAGRPVDTSMGLTPLEGLVMGTRGGDLDPGVVLHLLRHGGLGVDELEELLHDRSGLRGLTGHGDLRDVTAAMAGGDEAAAVAYGVYCHRIRKYVGAYLAVLGGADVVTFTAGVGENAAALRADCLRGLERLGLEIDDRRNLAGGSDARRISSDSSAITVLVVPTDEELAIARQVAALLARSPSPSP